MGCGPSNYSDTDSVDDINSDILYEKNIEWVSKLPWGRAQKDDEDDEMTEERAQELAEQERLKRLREKVRKAAQRQACEARKYRTAPPCVICAEDFNQKYQEFLLTGVVPKEFQKDVCGEECVEDENEAEEDKCPGAKKRRQKPRPCDGSCRT